MATSIYCGQNVAPRTITEAAPLIRAGKLSPAELLEESLAAIEKDNRRLNVFLTVTAESARDDARRAEQEIRRGRYRGPLHGIPISLKDLIWTRGVRTTGGSRILKDFVPHADAPVVKRLKDAGAVILGKTALHEWAYGVTNNNPHYGPTRNPHDPQRIPGGSSGGSAVAVATGMGLASIGSDTGGSVRIPAALCGVAGLKPTFGAIPVRGVIPLAPSFDHVGPLTRSVADAALVFEALSGRRLGRVSRTLRIGVPEKFFYDRLQPEVAAAVREALRRLERQGARLQRVEVPLVREMIPAALTVQLREAVRSHRRYRGRRREYGDAVRTLLERGESVTAAEERAARRVCAQFTRALAALFRRVDVLITPTLPATAPLIGQETIEIGGQPEDIRPCLTRLVRPFNVAGVPALSLPCGRDRRGLPIGLQVIGARRGEAAVLATGTAVERLISR
jgi:aspartyl-tRNA(Asn)/glutamyl-tRNA(Gln) amidotransferase subunit A